MKKNIKYLLSLALVATSFGFVACDEDDDYTSARQESGAQVYFSNQTPDHIYLPADGSTYSIPVCRIKDDEALDVAIKVIAKRNLFDFAEKVTFAAGEKLAELEVKYDIEKVGFDQYDTVTIQIADSSLITQYGFSELTFIVGAPAPWTTIGKAVFTESFWAEKSYNVDLQQNDVDPSLYRLVLPFADKSAYDNNAADYFQFKIYKKGETLAGQVLAQDIVYYDDTPIYLHPSYNDVIYICHPSSGFTSTTDQSTWTYNCVKSYQEDGTPAVVQMAPFYYMFNTGGWNYTAKEDIITIVFPGVVILDLSAEVEYTGKLTNVAGESFALTDVTLGSDVAKAAVAICRGDDVETLADAVLAGEAEFVEITKSGTVSLLMPSDDLAMYSILVIPFDAEGNPSLKDAASTNFRVFRAKNESPWDLSTPKIGDYYYDGWFGGNDEGYVMAPSVDDEGNACFVIYGVAGECDFVFYKDENDSVWFDPQLLLEDSDYGYGKIYMYPASAVKGYENEVSSYDPATGTFTFAIAFVAGGDVLTISEEYYSITGDYIPEPSAPMYRSLVKSNRVQKYTLTHKSKLAPVEIEKI